MRQLRKHAMPVAAIIGLFLVALAVGGYILVNQRLKLPWDDTYSVEVELQTAQALTPGQGQTVTVAGVQVGEIGNVSLRDGRAIVRLDIDRNELDDVHADATVVVRPKTGLQDMTIDMDPGSERAPVLRDGDVLPVERATPQVNVDEVIAGLDGDVRGYVQSLLQGIGDGLSGDGGVDLRKVLTTSEPLLARTKQLTRAVAARRRELSGLVSRLASLSDRVGDQSGDLVRLVAQGDATFGAIAAEDRSVRSALAQLPGTLREADGALAAARPLARELRPALERLTPTARKLEGALQDLRPLATEGRPAVRALQALTARRPAVRQLATTLRALEPLTPDLTRAVDVLDYVGNELGHNPEGEEEGYLFWLAWFAHNLNSMLSTSDANGGLWRGQLVFSCSNVDALGLLLPVLQPAADAGICPE